MQNAIGSLCTGNCRYVHIIMSLGMSNNNQEPHRLRSCRCCLCRLIAQGGGGLRIHHAVSSWLALQAGMALRVMPAMSLKTYCRICVPSTCLQAGGNGPTTLVTIDIFISLVHSSCNLRLESRRVLKNRKSGLLVFYRCLWMTKGLRPAADKRVGWPG